MLHVVGSTAETKALLRQQESTMDLRPRVILRPFRRPRGAGGPPGYTSPTNVSCGILARLRGTTRNGCWEGLYSGSRFREVTRRPAPEIELNSIS
jgi:hypothetical protein